MLKIHPIAAFDDNYIWILVDPIGKKCAVVDPGDANPVIEYCEKKNLSLTHILITHHHWDHTNGIGDLLDWSQDDVQVYGPENNEIKQVQHRLKEGDQIEVLGHVFRCIEVPGHTLDHIAYFGHKMLFCGDSLFSGGCGRLFEGSKEQLCSSLDKLRQLPEETRVYCTHEYTQANLRFALTVDPTNNALQSYANLVDGMRKDDICTLPSSIGNERSINPFLRFDEPEIVSSALSHSDKKQLSDAEVVGYIRQWKDNF